MTVKEQILDLFEQLSNTDKYSLIEKLNKKDVSETILIEDAPILSCPHCESKLFVKNGKRATIPQ